MDAKASRLENADRVMRDEGGNPELAALYQIALQLERRMPLGNLAKGAVSTLETVLGYERSAILLVDRESKRLKPFALAKKGYGPDFSQAQQVYLATHDLHLGAGIEGGVALDGRSVCLGDVQAVPRYQHIPAEIRSVACVPISVEGFIVGVISVESNQLNAYTESDLKVLETVSRHLALAIQNAHYHARVGEELSRDTIETAQPAPSEAIKSPAESLPASTLTRESEDQFRAIVQELQAQNEELNAFNHTVAHDLKNPLSILLGFAEVLAQDYCDGEDEVLDQGIRVILENGRRMETIINELLLLAEVRQLDEITVEMLDMASIVVETRKRLSNLIAEYGAKITSPAAWPPALGYGPWVEEIWVNYLSNAIKYGGRPPQIELGAMVQSDAMVRFWVRDNGAGISPEDQKQLFVPFTKLKQVNTKGHGLGLSIVHRITKKLGGQVGVESNPGDGSLFWFTLPMAE